MNSQAQNMGLRMNEARQANHRMRMTWRAGCALISAIAAMGSARAADSEPPPAPIVRLLPAAEGMTVISNVSLFRVDNEHAAMRVEIRPPASPSHLRVLLDLDPSVKGDLDSGADFMVEGGVGFIPGKGGGLRWMEKGAMPWVTADGAAASLVHWILLPPLSGETRSFGWAVEAVPGGAANGARSPAKGMSRANLGELPLLEPPAIEPPATLKESAQLSGPISPRFPALLESYPWESIPVSEADAGTLAPSFLSGPVRISLRLRDARTKAEVPCIPTRAWRDGDLRYRWAGETLGLKWDVILERSAEQELRVVGGVESPDGTERPIEWTVTATLPSAELKDDPASEVLRNGSLLPFDMASLPGGAVVLLKDTLEPHESEFARAANGSALELRHRMMLTPRTLRFPNRGTISCSVRAIAVTPGVSAMRAVVAALHERGGLSRAALPPESTRGATQPSMVLRPWAVDLPWPDAWPRTESSARALLLWYAAVRGEADIPGARSAWLAGMRCVDGGWAMEMGDALTPFGVRLPVSVNPALATTAAAPWNPARRVIQSLDGMMRLPSKGWMELDGESADGAVDSNMAALACASYPAVYRDPQGPPLVAAEHSAVELVRTIASRSPAERPILAVRGGVSTGCALAPWTDVFVESTRDWISMPPEQRQAKLWALRALAGARPIWMRVDDGETVPPAIANEFLSLGVQCIGGASQQQESSVYAARLAAAGWQAWGSARTSVPNLRIESFGTSESPIRHATVVSTADTPVTAEIRIPCSGAEVAVVQPLTGESQVVSTTNALASVQMTIPARTVTILDWFAVEQAPLELEFLDTQKSDAARAARSNLDSAIAARSAGWEIAVNMPALALSGARNTLQIAVRNNGKDPGVVERVRLLRNESETGLSAEPRMLAAGDAMNAEGFVAEPGRLVVRADVQRGGQRQTLSRELRPVWVPMVEVIPESSAIVCAGKTISVSARVINRSALPRRVAVQLGGSNVEAQTLDLGAGEAREISVLVNGREGTVQSFQWQVTAEGGWTQQAPVRVEFLNIFLGALRDSRTRVSSSSSEPGRLPAATVDGNAATAWASARGDASPSISFHPAESVRSSGLRVRWPYLRGVAQTPSKVALDVTDSEGHARTIEAQLEPAGMSVIPFTPMPIRSIGLRLLPHSGPPSAPDRLWIAEAELQ